MVTEANNIEEGIPAIRESWLFFPCLIVFIFLLKTSNAGQVESLTITEIDGVFEVQIVALFDAPAEYVYKVITDYKHIYHINPSIIETQILPPPRDDIARVRNRLERCIAVFCIEMDLVEDIAEVNKWHLVVTAVPELSSFKSGRTMWHVRSFGDGRSRVQYRSSLEPKFFIPPLIGGAIVKSILQDEITTSFIRIECHAKIMANKTWSMALHLADRTDEDSDCLS
jgi:hypothetical protein